MRDWLVNLPFYLASLSTEFHLVVAFCLLLLVLSLSGGRQLIAGAVFLAFLIASYFQDPPAL